MSSSAVDGVNGIAPPLPLDPTVAGPQSCSKPQPATTQATSASSSDPSSLNATPPILLIPTKPPLSAKVMAELLGEPMSLFGSTSPGDSAREQHTAHTQTVANPTTTTTTTTVTTTTTTTANATPNAKQPAPSFA